MQKYTYKFANHKILTQEQEKELFKEYHTETSPKHKAYLRDKLISLNMKFAARCANTYNGKFSYVDQDDLKSYAMLGLIHAIDEYDYTKNVKFTSFAVFWIKSYINRNVEKYEGFIRYPSNLHRELYLKNINKEEDARTLEMQNNIRGLTSLDQQVSDSDENDKTLADSTYDHQAEDIIGSIYKNQLENLIDKAFKKLSYDEQYIIKNIFGFNEQKITNKELANELNMTYEKLRSIRRKCLLKIKQYLYENKYEEEYQIG
jgi:RNA polymerase primary sigma factor